MSREERGGQHQQPRPQQQQPGGRKPRSYEAEEMLTGNFDIDDDPYGVIRVDDVEFGEKYIFMFKFYSHLNPDSIDDCQYLYFNCRKHRCPQYPMCGLESISSTQ